MEKETRTIFYNLRRRAKAKLDADFKRFYDTESARAEQFNKYKGTDEQKTRKVNSYFERLKQKQESELFKRIELIENAPEFEDTTITVIFKRSRMWGWNPIAEDDHGRNSGSIGGCGYDKIGTAVASVMNLNLSIIKRLCELQDKHPKTEQQDLFGYGLTGNIIPNFDGGCGVSTFEGILKTVGLKFSQVAYRDDVRVYSIKEATRC